MRLRRTSRSLLVIAAVLLGSGASVAISGPAHAVSGLTTTSGWSSASGSESFKYAVAVCPAGTKVLGGGADIVGGGGHSVRLASVVPSAPGFPTHSIYATAAEAGSYSANWSLWAWAMCGSGVTGWEIATNSYSVGPLAGQLGVSVDCPSGKKVIGMGGAVIGGSPYVLTGFYPFMDLSGSWVSATGDETTPIPGSTWGAKAYAICINPVAQHQVVSKVTASTSEDKLARVTCPSGTYLHSTGGKVHEFGEVYLDRIGRLGSPIVTADIDAREDSTGSGNNWTATVFAICAS